MMSNIIHSYENKEGLEVVDSIKNFFFDTFKLKFDFVESNDIRTLTAWQSGLSNTFKLTDDDRFLYLEFYIGHNLKSDKISYYLKWWIYNPSSDEDECVCVSDIFKLFTQKQKTEIIYYLDVIS